MVTWPERITGAGGLRGQFSHVNDLAPTILEAAGLEPPELVDGVPQEPVDGTSLVYSFDDAAAPERHTTQYFEVYGHRSLYHEGWMASAHHGGVPWSVGRPGEQRPFERDVWELYQLDEDFSQARDLAAEHPGKLARLTELFVEEAARAGILPLRDARVARGEAPLPNLARGRASWTFFAGTVGIPESNAPRLLGRSWTLRAHLDAHSAPRGVIMSVGGRGAGMAFYLDDSARPVLHLRTFDVAALEVVGDATVGSGEHVVGVDFAYDGPGVAKGAEVTLTLDGAPVGQGWISVTPPAIFSIDETFDVGMTTGSAVAPYTPPYAFTGGRLGSVTFEPR